MYQCSQSLAKVLKILCTLLESTALKPEGVLVLFAECGMGIGELQVLDLAHERLEEGHLAVDSQDLVGGIVHGGNQAADFPSCFDGDIDKADGSCCGRKRVRHVAYGGLDLE